MKRKLDQAADAPAERKQLKRQRVLSALCHRRTYQGVFVGDSVWIHDDKDVEDLLARGCFGKAALSRSEPEFDKFRENKALAATADTKTREQPFKEHFQLGLEESFFLAHVLKCLQIKALSGSELAMSECWNEFRRAEPRFPALYTAYHFLRTRAWVPKTGLKFGVDFVIYKLGPSYYHAHCSVVVKLVTTDLVPVDVASARDEPTASIQNLQRMTHNVAKDVLLLYVIVPSPAQPVEVSAAGSASDRAGSAGSALEQKRTASSQSATARTEASGSGSGSAAGSAAAGSAAAVASAVDWSSPDCVGLMSVHTVMVRRWTPSGGREAQ